MGETFYTAFKYPEDTDTADGPYWFSQFAQHVEDIIHIGDGQQSDWTTSGGAANKGEWLNSTPGMVIIGGPETGTPNYGNWLLFASGAVDLPDGAGDAYINLVAGEYVTGPQRLVNMVPYSMEVVPFTIPFSTTLLIGGFDGPFTINVQYGNGLGRVALRHCRITMFRPDYIDPAWRP